MTDRPQSGGRQALAELGVTVHRFSNQLDTELRHAVMLNHFEVLLLQTLRHDATGVQLRHLPQLLQCSHQRVSLAVRRLERRGLIWSGLPAAGGSAITVGLTLIGRTAIDRATPVYLDLLEQLMREHLPESLPD